MNVAGRHENGIDQKDCRMREITIERKLCHLCGILQMTHRDETCLVKISLDEEMFLPELFCFCGRKVMRVHHELKWLEISTSKSDGLMELGTSFVKD